MKPIVAIVAVVSMFLSESVLSQAVLVGDSDIPEYRDAHKQ
jgi:hypothetical protein